jgi:hypothetical protein
LGMETPLMRWAEAAGDCNHYTPGRPIARADLGIFGEWAGGQKTAVL